MPSQRTYPQIDLSGGLQSTTSHLLRKTNEVTTTKNAVYNEVIGAFKRRPGYEQVHNTIQSGNDSLYGGVFCYGTNNKIISGINNSGGTAAALRYADTGGYWTDILNDATVNTRFCCHTWLDELYVAGYARDTDTRYPLTNVDSTLTTSTTRNVLGAPKAAFVAEYKGSIYAINVEVKGVKYPDRAYYSSPPLGAITFVQTDQAGLLTQLRVDAIKYLKAGMQVDIYGAGTEAQKVSALTIVSVDKKNTRITFAPTNINVADNDEIWLTGRKGKLNQLWNLDTPTPESADFIKVPAGLDASPAFTGVNKNNGRLFFFTRNSVLKYDGSNLTPVSENVGCISHETIRNIGSWMIWTHTTGVWGYNDNTGEVRLLSKSIAKYIRAINQPNLRYSSAVVNLDNVYKLSVGELLPFNLATTSTSTSSTSTSSTSSSTSSTSTSSTSTSSTSTSTSRSTTSTSSTSVSTSTTSTSSTSVSTSTSSTSISTSTSSTSTSTTTASPGKQVVRLCYDWDSNIWWTEYHRREIRFQFMHNMHGYTKPYFTDETGRMFRDETGNMDNNDTIPMEVELGRDNFGLPIKKNYSRVTVDTQNAAGAVIAASIDGGNFNKLGQLVQNVNDLDFPFNAEGTDVDYKFTHNDKGEPPVVNGLTTTWSPQEIIQGAGQ